MSGVTPFLGLILPADGEAYDLDILTANYNSIDAALKEADKAAKGLKFKYFDATTSGNFNTIEGLVCYVLVSLVKDRWYHIKFSSQVISAGASQPIFINIKRDSDTSGTTTFATGGTIANISTVTRRITQNSGTLPITADAEVFYQAPATETILLKITGALATATGTNFQWAARSINVLDSGMQIP